MAYTGKMEGDGGRQQTRWASCLPAGRPATIQSRATRGRIDGTYPLRRPRHQGREESRCEENGIDISNLGRRRVRNGGKGRKYEENGPSREEAERRKGEAVVVVVMTGRDGMDPGQGIKWKKGHAAAWKCSRKKGGRVPGVPDSAQGVLWCQCFPLCNSRLPLPRYKGRRARVAAEAG